MSRALEQVRIGGDEIEVVVLPELGARLHRIRAFGIDLLRTPEDVEDHRRDPFFWGAYVMAPWCNRVAAEPIDVAGRRVEVAPNFPDDTAIHGLVYERAWAVDGEGTFSVRAGGRDGWPWPFEVTSRVSADGGGIALAYELTNAADAPMPSGLGLHPWLRSPIEVGLPAASVYPSNTEPPQRPRSVDGQLDLRRQAPVPAGLDATWTDLGPPEVTLSWPSSGISGRLSVTSPTPHVAVASPESIEAVAIEPQTHAPWGVDRLRRGEPGAVALLEPGATLRLVVRLELTKDPQIGG